MFEKILVGYDGSKGGKAALAGAVALAGKFGSQVTALWVREPLPRHSDLPGESEAEAEAADDYFKERQQEVAAVASQHGCRSPVRRAGGTPPRISFKRPRWRLGLIVVGHKRSFGAVGSLAWRHR